MFLILVLLTGLPLAGVGGSAVLAQEPDTTLTYRHFQVLESNGRIVGTRPVPDAVTPLWARDVSQIPATWSDGPDPDRPYFEGPIPFVLPPVDEGEPFYPHNHAPSITWLGNGDLLAAWYSTVAEEGPLSTVLASRLRRGRTTWDPSSEFFKEPSRSMPGADIWYDGQGTLFQISHLPALPGPHAGAGIIMRLSTDNGVTWTPARPISSGDRYANGHYCGDGLIGLSDGTLLFASDVASQGNSVIHVSLDGGRSWSPRGGLIRGMHAKVAELSDGRLLALGRRGDLLGIRSSWQLNRNEVWRLACASRDDSGRCVPADSLGELRMPMSRSPIKCEGPNCAMTVPGLQWESKASPFPPIGGGQRLELLRLQEGPLLLVSFTSMVGQLSASGSYWSGMTFVDESGNEFTGHGMYAALSWDDGETWPVRKLITPGSGEYDGGAWTGPFEATPTRAEHSGYLSGIQTPDGVIHLISSRLHYRFNLAWLTAGTGAASSGSR